MTGWEMFDRLYERYDKWFSENAITVANELDVVITSVRGLERPCVEVGSGTGSSPQA